MTDQHHSLRVKLDSYPRIPLAQYPTPLEFLPRLSRELDRRIYVKRDDAIGPGLGGNKTRKLEYLLADAQQRNLRKVVTFGGLQSNHARITAAACCKLGMEPHLFYFERRPRHLTGNMLLNATLGAKMHFIPLGMSATHQSQRAKAGQNSGMTLETTIRLVALLARLRVGRHYYIPVGGHSWLGCLGYVRAALEIDEQARALGLDNAYLIVAAGSGGTLAGLLAGLALVDSHLQPLGIDVGKLWKGFPASIARLTGELCRRLGQPRPFKPSQVMMIEGTYTGPAYAVPTSEGQAAIQRLARLEGIFLDPVYTGKAFAGLLDLVERHQLGKDEPVIFLHTGGTPALFAF